MNLHVQVAADGSALAVSGAATFVSWLTQDVPIAIFGVPFSVLLAGFAGAMAIVSFLPPFETRRKMWSTVLVCTIAAGYLTKVALKVSGWDGGLILGVAFGIGFLFQVAGQLIVQNGKQLFDAAAARIRGGP